MLREPSQVDKAVERMRTLTRPVGITGQRDWDVAVVDGSRIVLTPTASGQSAAVDNAMQQAVEVIRRRIDEMGTREPTIIRQGQNRIVVQRSEEHTSELQSLMRNSYAVFCLKKKIKENQPNTSK